MLRITIDMFSGRPNPSWVIEGDRCDLILHELAALRSAIETPPRPISHVGYRRILVEPLQHERSQVFPNTIAIANCGQPAASAVTALAERLIGEAPIEPLLITDFPGITEHVRQRNARDFFIRKMQQACATLPGGASEASEVPPETTWPYLPKFEANAFSPEYWNDPMHVVGNNCYAYACDQRVDSFPQPGRAAGREARFYSAQEVVEAVLCDGVVPAAEPVGTTEQPGHLVALFLWPGIDYHCYRLHSDRVWGHKPGPTLASTLDNDFIPIHDPRVCSRADYSDFCGLFIIPKSVSIR